MNSFGSTFGANGVCTISIRSATWWCAWYVIARKIKDKEYFY